MQSATGNFGPTLEQRLGASISRLDSLSSILAQSMRVALPGIVQKFNVGPPATVTVLVPTNEYVTQNTGGTILKLSTTAQQLPLLVDVPVVIPSAGGWSLTLPIKEGDECLLVFCDTPIDVWMESGSLNNNPISQRRHSLSDAIAVFGLRSQPRGLSGYSTTSAQLRSDDGTVVIDLAPDQITVTAPTVQVNASDTANVSADHVVLNGSGDVTISGNTKIDSRIFLMHKHTGVQAGLANTGPVL